MEINEILSKFIDLINAIYSHILPQAKIHILTAGLVNVGYFGIKDFNDTDLIVWEDGTAVSFSEYLKALFYRGSLHNQSG